MVGDAVVGNSSVEKGTTAREAEVDRYAWVWNRIRQLDPQAVLLRGPERLNPVQAAGQGDLDILVPTGMAEARAFLKKQGFERVYKPQAYLERYRFRSPELPEPSTIDLYKAERWGLGFRLARNGHVPADARLGCLLHAVADGKGTAYFEKQQNGPPWQQDHEGSLAGPLARVLWRAGSSGILTLYLLLKGVIRPDLPMVFSNLCRRIAFRAWQLTRKTGLEVALLGVDGTGKSSLSSALLQLPAPVKAVYMGPHDYQTRIMRFALKHDLPLPVQQLAFRYDLFVRRLCGWLLARRGWIVVYDRHPAERLEPGKRSFRNAIKSVLDRFYAWPVDVTFWLTGDYRTIYLRKKEYPAAYLQVIDQRFQSVLERYRIPFDKIDVTQSDLVSVAQLIRDRVLAKYQERVSMDRLSGIFKTILE